VSPRLKGSTAVRVEVKVKSVTIASEMETILVGGVHGMTADVTFIDVRTKAVLFTTNSFSNQVGGGGGVGGLVIDRAVLSPPIDRIAEGFAFQYGEMLRPSEPRS
jgi:ribulose 1,5-bisphosphate synthetase/thiazole synthase